MIKVIILIIIIVLLIALAGIANAIMDTLKHHYLNSIFSTLKSNKWWIKSCPQSWILKYEHKIEPVIPSTDNRRFNIIKLSDKAAFLGSKTWRVWKTDTWHLAQFIMLSSFQLAIICGIFLGILITQFLPIISVFWVILFVIIFFFFLKFTFSAWFTLFYDFILIKKKLF